MHNLVIFRMLMCMAVSTLLHRCVYLLELPLDCFLRQLLKPMLRRRELFVSYRDIQKCVRNTTYLTVTDMSIMSVLSVYPFY